jgi:bifunctional non-homologous end joining protein LigD
MPRKKDAGPAFTVAFPKPLPAERRGEHWWMEVDGRELRLSNLDKVFWPEEGYTKGDLIAYYFNIAPRILPYLRERPLTLKRMPDGAFGPFFYEKNAPPYTPEWLSGCAVETTGNGGRWGNPRDPKQYRSSRQNAPNKEFIQYMMVEDVAGMLFVANMGCIEFHPLHSRCGSAETPDYLFFDLDPFDVPFEAVMTVAAMVKVVCDQLGLRAYPKTSGATGMQVYVPIRPEYTYGQIRDFVGKAGHLIRQVDPARVTMEWEVRKRTGKVFIDHNMNRQGANISAVYSVRPERGAPVSTPLTWKEVEAGQVRPEDFTIATVWDRIRGKDPFRPVLGTDQDLGPALAALGVSLEDELPDTESIPIPMPPTGDPRTAAREARGSTGSPKPASPAARSPRRPATSPSQAARSSRRPAKSRAASKSDEVIARSKDPKLGRYLKMRDFEATPEPAGGAASSAGNSFVIQRHDATRLHYDLRLEREGVLVSWAVPKGVPFVKGEKHLAVQTEDHPMEYARFAGTIPEGHYGAGEVRIWDKGAYDLLEWTDKKVSFRLHGERHRGEYHLVKTRDRDWLIFLSKPEEAAPEAPPQFQPMLATGGYKPFDGNDWWFEPKLDGVRTLLYLNGEDVRLISRTGRDQTATYPELHRTYRRINATNAVLDGEIVTTNEQGVTSFELLQQRMNLSSPGEIERIRKRIPVELVAFDLLWIDGEDWTGRPLNERRARLTEAVMEDQGIRLIYWTTGEGKSFYRAAQGLGLEGVIGKRAASRYLPGRRTDDWRKIKILKTQDCVILGWTPGQGGRGNAFGSLLIGAYKSGQLIWVGHVGTGFTDRMLGELMKRLRAVEVHEPPIGDADLRKEKGAHWVRPELVCEVEYLQMTVTGKLRAPSFKGLRPDKLPEDCILEPDPSVPEGAEIRKATRPRRG